MHFVNDFQTIFLSHSLLIGMVAAQRSSGSIYYTEADRKGNQFVKTISKIFLTHLSCGVFGLAIMNGFYNLCIGNYHPETWYLPYMISLPFDRRTYSGYLLSLLAQMLAGYTYILTMCAVSTFFVAGCFYIEACLKHFQDKVRDIDVLVISKAQNVRYDLGEIVHFHTQLIEWVFCEVQVQSAESAESLFIDCSKWNWFSGLPINWVTLQADQFFFNWLAMQYFLHHLFIKLEWFV